jgi:hypothetical protein
LFAADPNIGLSSFSMPKELLPQLETEEDLEQILADAGEGDTTDGTTFVLWFSSVSRPEFAVLIGVVFVHVE